MITSCSRSESCTLSEKEPMTKRFFDIGVIGGLFFIVFVIMQEFSLIPDMGTLSVLTYSTAFLLGLVASSTTCMATTGTVFLLMFSHLREIHITRRTQYSIALLFFLGRVLMYGVGGTLLGWIGKTTSVTSSGSFILSLFVAIMMVLMGLEMLKLVSFRSLIPRSWSENLFSFSHRYISKAPFRTSFLLGVATYWLPCGFTQTVHVYALGLADPFASGGMMIAFALGTLPALFAVAYMSSFRQGGYYVFFTKMMGMIILLIGFQYMGNVLGIQGLSFSSKQEIMGVTAELKENYQEVRMTVDANGYSPESVVVKKGIPVKWILEGNNVFGCQGSLVSSDIDIQTTLKPGENILEFVPQKKGKMSFGCSMGMFNGSFTVM